jgi:DNA replication protein DnaC
VKHEELISNLKRLHLMAMAREYAAMARQCEQGKRTYEQYLAAMVALEIQEKGRQKVARLLKEAKLPHDKRLETYDFRCRTGITEQQVRRLGDGDFVRQGGNVVFYGSFGVGKSHLGMALTRMICEAGWRCYFTSSQALINDLLVAQKNLTLASLFRRLDRFDVITLDELGYTPQSKDGADLFFQLISQRYERKSLIITTNLTYSEWDQVFLNPVTTAAAVDRVIHNCETFNIKGPSWRAEAAKRRAQTPAQPPGDVTPPKK